MTHAAAKGDAVEVLRRLVAVDSRNPPNNSKPIIAAVLAIAADLGLRDPLVVGPDPQHGNVLIEVGSSGGPCLALLGHLDTVPCEPRQAWLSDPLKLIEANGRLRGLGTADMKGGVAAMLIAEARMAETITGPGKLRLLLTCDEESGSKRGTQWLVEHGHLVGIDAAATLEPGSSTADSWDALYIAHRGSCTFWLEATGVAGHSGVERPVHDRAASSLARGMLLMEQLASRAPWRHPVDGSGITVNIGTILQAGEIAWAHPRIARCMIEVRTVPGMTAGELLGLASTMLHEAGLSNCLRVRPDPDIEHWFPPSSTIEDTRLLEAAAGAWQDVFGIEPRTAVFPASTDSNFLNAVGIPCLPALGPGSLAVVHQPNESLALTDLHRAVELIHSTAVRYLCPTERTTSI